MTNLCITYQMRNAEGLAETCITLPMTEAMAADILERGADSEHLDSTRIGDVYRALKAIASMQGYTYDGFCCAEKEENK